MYQIFVIVSIISHYAQLFHVQNHQESFSFSIKIIEEITTWYMAYINHCSYLYSLSLVFAILQYGTNNTVNEI